MAMPEARGQPHPTAASGATTPLRQGSWRPKFYTVFPLLTLQPWFRHTALGQTTASTNHSSLMLVGEGPVNSMNFTSLQLQNRYEQVLCWQLELQLYFIYSSIRADVAVIQRFSQP